LKLSKTETHLKSDIHVKGGLAGGGFFHPWSKFRNDRSGVSHEFNFDVNLVIGDESLGTFNNFSAAIGEYLFGGHVQLHHLHLHRAVRESVGRPLGN